MVVALSPVLAAGSRVLAPPGPPLPFPFPLPMPQLGNASRGAEPWGAGLSPCPSPLQVWSFRFVLYNEINFYTPSARTRCPVSRREQSRCPRLELCKARGTLGCGVRGSQGSEESPRAPRPFGDSDRTSGYNLKPHLFVSAGSAAGPGHWGPWSQLSGALPQLGIAPGTVKSPKASALPWDEVLGNPRAGWGRAAPLVCGIFWAARAERGPRVGGHSPARLWGAHTGMEQSWCGQEAMLRGMGCKVLGWAVGTLTGTEAKLVGTSASCSICLVLGPVLGCWDPYWDAGTHTGVQVPAVGCTEPYWDAGTCARINTSVLGCVYPYWDAGTRTGMQVPVLGCRFL